MIDKYAFLEGPQPDVSFDECLQSNEVRDAPVKAEPKIQRYECSLDNEPGTEDDITFDVHPEGTWCLWKDVEKFLNEV